VYRAKIRVTLRKSILDPQGKAVEQAIATLGVRGVNGVRIGKFIEVQVDAASEGEAQRVTEQVCKKLLANPVMEDYVFELEKI
jgi:phosphoribosylformylglycinamidine synthase subunit PurS